MPAAGCRVATVVAVVLSASVLSFASSVSEVELASVSAVGLLADDECSLESTGDAGGSPCAVNALQRQSVSLNSSLDADSAEISVDSGERANASGSWSHHIRHYAQDCWKACNGAGMCENWCGPENACCRFLHPSDPPECQGIRFWPLLHAHTCVHSPWGRGAGAPSPTGSRLIYTDPRLFKPSKAPLMDFYMYRAQTNETYDPENQDLGNAGGVLWYLHNEIVWHPHLKRSGTYFSHSKTRIERFRVKARATEPLYDLGMNFGVVNTFDSTKCTGPFKCDNFRKYGYTVGCETWVRGSSAFPHSQWVGKNVYPGAKWYSLPGPCSSKGLGDKTASCLREEPGGACHNDAEPTGEGNCTYNFAKVGEIAIDDLEGITDPEQFVANGGAEYDRKLDDGIHNHFWAKKGDVHADQWRINQFLRLFKEKYPDQPELEEPPCDFNKYKLFPGRHWR